MKRPVEDAEPELRLRAVADSVTDAVISADGEGRIIFWNLAAGEIFGYSGSEILGRPLMELMPERFRDPHRAGLQRVGRGGEPHVLGRGPVRLEGLHRDGHEFPIELSLGRWTGPEGAYYTGTIRDVTELVAAQRQVNIQFEVAKALAESATVADAAPRLLEAIGENLQWQAGAMWLLDSDALRLNAHWQAADVRAEPLERAGRELALGRGEGLPGRVWSSGRALWMSDVTRDPEFRRRNSATEAEVRGAVGLPLLSGSEVVGVLEFFTYRALEVDPPLLENLEATAAQIGQFVGRREAEERLRRSEALLSEFAYVASHDLAEPLRTIAGYAELLEGRYREQLDAQAQLFIGHIVDGTGRMERMIRALLEFSRAGQGRIERRQVDTLELVNVVLTTLQASIQSANATITVGELPVVRADEQQLAQLFQNLISNAVKFAGDADPEVTITAERISADGEVPAWRFAIADNGIGIAPEHAQRIFVPFARLHSQDRYEGTGIGLSICQRIVEHHGGEIRAEANPHGGTLMTFTIAD